MAKTDVVQLRHTEILQQFEDAGSEGLTIIQLASMLDMNYHTLRKDMEFLSDRGKIAANGRVRDKSHVYAATGKYNVPTILVNRTQVPFTAFIDQALEGRPATPLNMTKMLRVTLMAIATRAALGDNGELDYYPKQIKTMLVDAVNRAEQFATAAKSILDDPRFWNERNLPDLLDVSAYDLDTLLLATRQLLGELTSE